MVVVLGTVAAVLLTRRQRARVLMGLRRIPRTSTNPTYDGMGADSIPNGGGRSSKDPGDSSYARVVLAETASALRRLDVPRSRVTLGAPLGAGEYGEVLRGQFDGTPVAVKRLLPGGIQSPSAEAAALGELMDEAVLTSALEHPHVVGVLGVCEPATPRCLVLFQLCADGSLEDVGIGCIFGAPQ